MSDATTALLELRAKIDANRKLLDKQEAALIVMEDMMGITSPTASSLNKSLDFSSNGNVISIDDLNVPDKSNRKTFKQEIIEVIELLGQQEFSVPHIHAALTGMGIKVNGGQPRARIAKMLSDLTEDKFIVKTHRGKGSDPHKFRIKSVV